MDHSPGFLRICEDARGRITEISASELLILIGDRSRGRAPGTVPAFYVLDVREDTEWQAGHIPGARHLSRGILERDIERMLPEPNAEIILYCGGGYRSALAADALQRMGYTRVRSLSGGFRGWQEAGHSIESEPEHVRALPLLPQHIVVAVDLTESGRLAVLSALDLAEATRAKVTLVHAIEPTPTPASLEAYALEGLPTDWAERINDARLRSAHHQVQAMVSMYGRPSVSVTGQVIFGLLPETLNSLLRSVQADLLIVGTHGRRGLAHFFLGSVAERLVRTAPCPVLVVRPSADPRSDASSAP